MNQLRTRFIFMAIDTWRKINPSSPIPTFKKRAKCSVCWDSHWDRSQNTSIPPRAVWKHTDRKKYPPNTDTQQAACILCLAFASASPPKNRRWKEVIFPWIAVVLQSCIPESSRDTWKIEGAGRGHQDKPQTTISNARPSKSCGWISKSDPGWKKKLATL